LLRKAVAVWQDLCGNGHPSYAAAVSDLAFSLQHTGEMHEAKTLLRTVEQIFRKTGDTASPGYAAVLSNLGCIAVRERRPERALALLVEAMGVERRVAHHTFAVCSEATRQGMLSELWNEAFGIISLVLVHLKDNLEALKTAFNVVVRQKGLDGEVHWAQRLWATGEGRVRQQPRWEAVHQRKRELGALILGAGSMQASDVASRVNELAQEIERLEAEMAGDVPTIELARRIERADLDAVVACLPAGSALVEYVRSPIYDYEHAFGDDNNVMPARYIAFVAAKSDGIGFRMFDLGPADLVDEMISAFRRELHPQSTSERGVGVIRSLDTAKMVETGTALRKAVVDPLIPGLGDVRDIFLSPDGDLSLLPFAVLPMEDGTFVIDHFHVNYLGASRDLVRLNDNVRAPSGPPLVVAAPDYDFCGYVRSTRPRWSRKGLTSRTVSRGALSFAPLPGTRTEGDEIARIVGTDLTLMGASATVSRVLSSGSPRILHMATHGFFSAGEDADIPNRIRSALIDGIGRTQKEVEALGLRFDGDLLRSGLAMAGANAWACGKTLPPDMRNGLLTAEDVVGMDLLNTELVVLSACDTGLGVVHLGEGVFGLRRAFALAGARTLVMSLWKVADQETRELMTEFYGRILRGEPRSEALRQAQLSLRKKHISPAIWGAFVCQGDPRPLPLAQAAVPLPP
jgi:CHAT domain-containing protein